MSGAGRGAKQNLLYTEIAEGINCYGVGSHRHMPEIEQARAHAPRGARLPAAALDRHPLVGVSALRARACASRRRCARDRARPQALLVRRAWARRQARTCA